MKRVLLLSLLAALAALGTDARAAGSVKRVGVQAGFAGVSGNEGTFSGYGGAVTFGWGLSDSFTLAANATGTSNQIAASGGRSLVLSQALGIEYALDVIQVVPYVGAYGSVYEISGGGVKERQLKWGGELALGINWIYSRDFTFGIDFRGHVLPEDFIKAPDSPSPFYITSFLKAEYTWGWF
jgi:hypothetical protein